MARCKAGQCWPGWQWVLACGLVIGGVFVIRDDAKAKADRAELEASLATKCEAYSWPESDIAALLPQPKSTKGEIKSESSDYFSIEVCGTDAKQYADYIKIRARQRLHRGL